MGAVKAIESNIKLNIAVEAIKNPDMTPNELAEKFGVSVSTVRRAKKDFLEEATKVLAVTEELPDVKPEVVQQVATQLILAPVTQAPEVDTTPAPVVAAPVTAAPAAPTEPNDAPRGYRPRNGRMEIIRDVTDKMGVDAPTKELYTRVNEVAAEMGVEPIKRSAFYVLICEVRKAAKAATQAKID